MQPRFHNTSPLKLSLPEAHQLALGRNVRVTVIDKC
jgi:hypothetical protein